MKTRFLLLTCLILTFLTACQSLIPAPTATSTAIPTNTPTPTATPTPTLTFTPTLIPTATRELTLEEKYGYLVPAEENVVLRKAGEFFNNDPQIPLGTKYTQMQFRATGESRREQSSLGEVATVQLVFRDDDGILRDIWMIFAGYSFGENKDGTNFMVISEGAGGSSKIGAPEELLKLVCPGTSFEVAVAWQKGTLKNIREEYYPNGIGNELFREAYRRIADDSEELKRLIEGNGVESSNFRLVPFYWWIRQGALIPSTNGFGWEFEAGEDTGCAEGWTAGNHITRLQVREGNLAAESTGDDPYIFSPSIPYSKYSENSGRWGPGFAAEDFPTIEIRMKVSSGYTGQLFFITNFPDYIQDYTFDGPKSLRFSIIGDGQFHTYILDMTKVMKWSGDIYQLRLDPTDTRAMIEIDYIRLLKGP